MITENIGKVRLIRRKEDICEPDEPFYQDFLRIARDNEESELQQIIADSYSFPLLYNFSHMRENVLEWMPWSRQKSVLEVGSAYGALTHLLAKRCMSVTALDQSYKRCVVNAWRNRTYDNLQIVADTFESFLSYADTKYDVVVLYDVMEIASSFVSGRCPQVQMLKTLKTYLKNSGKIVMITANRYALKYWAGVQDPRTGTYFAGIEGYPGREDIQALSLSDIYYYAAESDLNIKDIYFPYPDEIFMLSLYSNDRLPKTGELDRNLRNFNQDRMLLMDETRVFNELIKENKFQDFSNAYIVIMEKA